MRSRSANTLAALALVVGAPVGLQLERDANGSSAPPAELAESVDGVRRDGQRALAGIRYPRCVRGYPANAVKAIDAFERLLADEIDRRISDHSPWVGGSARTALHMIVRASSDVGALRLDGLVHVSEWSEGDAIIVIHAVPEDRLRSLPIDVPAALGHLACRVRAGEASHVEAMALFEALPEAQAWGIRDDVLAAVDRAVGDGFGASADRRWVRRDGARLRQGLSLWGASSGTVSSATADAPRDPLPDAVVSRVTPELSLLLLGHRANDPAVISAVRAHLTDAGWARVARLLPDARLASP